MCETPRPFLHCALSCSKSDSCGFFLLHDGNDNQCQLGSKARANAVAAGGDQVYFRHECGYLFQQQ